MSNHKTLRTTCSRRDSPSPVTAMVFGKDKGVNIASNHHYEEGGDDFVVFLCCYCLLLIQCYSVVNSVLLLK